MPPAQLISFRLPSAESDLVCVYQLFLHVFKVFPHLNLIYIWQLLPLTLSLNRPPNPPPLIYLLC